MRVFAQLPGVPSEGDGIRTRNHRIDSPVSPQRKTLATKQVAETGPKPLAHSLAREVEKDPDLVRLVELWERLPEAGRKLLRQTAETFAENCLDRADNRPRLASPCFPPRKRPAGPRYLSATTPPRFSEPVDQWPTAVHWMQFS